MKKLGYINYGYDKEPGEGLIFKKKRIALGSVVIIMVLTVIALGVVFGLQSTTSTTTSTTTTITTTTPSPLSKIKSNITAGLN